MKKLFIENDSRFDESRMGTLSKLFDKNYLKSSFDIVITDASFNGPEVLKAILQCDEIYMDTALVYNPFGDATTLFNNMMYYAIKENITGKSVYIFRQLDEVQWDGLKADFMDKAFKQNYLYVIAKPNKDTFDTFTWEQVDIDKLIKDQL